MRWQRLKGLRLPNLQRRFRTFCGEQDTLYTFVKFMSPKIQLKVLDEEISK